MPVYTPVRGFLPTFNVKEYGALGDGTADDSAALTAAITAAKNAGGGTVYLPKGTYRLASAWTGLQAANNVKLQGQTGDAPSYATSTTVIRCEASLGAAAVGISAINSYGLEIVNITFQINTVTASTARCLDITNSQDISIRNCAFLNTSGNARFGYGVEIGSALRVTIDKSYFSNFNSGVTTNTSGSRLVSVRDCMFDTYTDGVYGRSGLAVLNWTVSGCDFIENTTGSRAVYFDGTTNVTVQGNRIRQTGAVATNGLINISNTNGASVTGNRIDIASGTTGATTRGLYITNATGLVATGNYIDTASGSAIYFPSSGDAATGLIGANSYGTTSAKRIENLPTSTAVLVAENAAGVYNVKDFGAKGDGSTNDAVAIVAAINAASGAGGGVVFFPKGVYVTSTAQGLSGITGVKLIGQSGMQPGSTPSVILRYGYALNGSHWSFANSTGMEVRNIRFEITNQTSASIYIVDFSGSTDLTVANCAFVNTNGTKAGSVGMGGVLRASFDRCHFLTTAYGLRGDSSGSNVTVRDCLFETNIMGITNPGSQWQIINGHFRNQVTYGIDGTAGVVQLTVQGCRFEASSANTSIAGYFNTSIITGSSFSPTTTGKPILLNTAASTNITIANNLFNQGTCGIDFASIAHSGHVISNTFFSTSRYLNFGSLGYNMAIVDDQTAQAVGTSHPVFDASTARWYVLSAMEDYNLITTTFAFNKTFARLWHPGRSGTLKGLAVNISTPQPGATLRAGLWTDNNGVPGTLVADFGTVGATGGGVVTWTITQTFTARPYWVTISPQGGTSSPYVQMYGPQARHTAVGDPNATPSFNASFNCYRNDSSYTGAYGTPGSTTFSLSGTDFGPQIMIKLQ